MAQTMRSILLTKDAATDPKTPSPAPEPVSSGVKAASNLDRQPRDFPREPPTVPRDPPRKSRQQPDPPQHEQITIHDSPRRPVFQPSEQPRAQQSKKRKLGVPSAGDPTRFTHLPSSLPLLALSPDPPSPPKPSPDPLAVAVAGYRSSQSRRAADITIALKHRSESQEMVSTHERWSQFSRGPEIARLDLLRTLDDAIAADREILRIITQELRDTLAAREAVGGIIDTEVHERGEKLAAVAPKRVVGRRRGHGVGGSVKRGLWLVVMLVAVVWAVRTFSA